MPCHVSHNLPWKTIKARKRPLKKALFAQAITALTRARGRFGSDAAAVEKEVAGISRGLQNAETQAAGASGAGHGSRLRFQEGALGCQGCGALSISCTAGCYSTRRFLSTSFPVISCSGTLYLHYGNCVCSAGLQQLFSERNLPPLAVGASLMLFQQITGQPSVLYYAAKIFKAAGFASDADATKVSVVLGFFKLLATGEPSCVIQTRRMS